MRAPFLIGSRIYLRGIEKTDLEGDYYQWLNDQEVTRWMQNGIFPNSAESMLDYYQSVTSSRTDMLLAIITKDEERHIGNIGLSHLNQLFRSAEIGILIGDKNSWGKDYGTEAISTMAGHAFRRMNLNRVYAGAVADNIGCIKAFEKAGFIQEGISRQAYYCEGEYRDCINLSLIRNEWESNIK